MEIAPETTIDKVTQFSIRFKDLANPLVERIYSWDINYQTPITVGSSLECDIYINDNEVAKTQGVFTRADKRDAIYKPVDKDGKTLFLEINKGERERPQPIEDSVVLTCNTNLPMSFGSFRFIYIGPKNDNLTEPLKSLRRYRLEVIGPRVFSNDFQSDTRELSQIIQKNLKDRR